VIDVLFSAIALVVLTPLILLIGIAIRLLSGPPVFYAQKRMGLDGKEFRIFKFRTMCTDAEREKGPVWASANDPRRTRIGSILRRYSLDELPQIVNVLKGDMSLVGPRPERPELIELFRERVPGYMLRCKVKAGLTGWAQVNGWRGDTSLEKRIDYDIQYMERWSITLDLKILFLTLWKGFINKSEDREIA
jgi:exopolysaccharide biosynthesis polyprenyl glycosylphosphotransferase